jgi:hypothetical protein
VNNLQLYVWKDDNIRSIQKKFSELFPHLWINLFRHSGGWNSLPKQDILFTRETKVADINPVLNEGKLKIDPQMTVSAFESAFYNRFGLFVQVSRTNCLRETGKFGIEYFALDEANQEVKGKMPEEAETIFFRDVPYGC